MADKAFGNKKICVHMCIVEFEHSNYAWRFFAWLIWKYTNIDKIMVYSEMFIFTNLWPNLDLLWSFWFLVDWSCTEHQNPLFWGTLMLKNWVFFQRFCYNIWTQYLQLRDVKTWVAHPWQRLFQFWPRISFLLWVFCYKTIFVMIF